ncbi:MAG: hypothetical protein GFH27_549281n271 [Chloroflexi bacterium AL-W]|nr:hypothetical protein [Chloroflexi bacterium AL-N1]NOK66156.1 hypothetical protein [Chloroflexi bacterium AL-N10]NOK73037.1 hypothetical protein [Chloroflexi bacterium AL-N5]NOK79934.1 hypothetical protein [Chloroflexi bacterium AL-W]NOK88210.1 hypothetical protein [Chloroflexi bacterium AL-N15]
MKQEYQNQYVVTGLSPIVRDQLHERVAYANGDLMVVEEELTAQIEEIDRGMKYHNETVKRRRLVDRAFFMAQLRYLKKYAQSLRAAQRSKSTIFKRIISFFHSGKTIPYNVP